MPERPSALTIPEVTVCCRPNGLPMAMTKSPTWSFEESARAISAGNLPSVTFRTATSERSSAPTTSAFSSISSTSVIVISLAFLIT